MAITCQCENITNHELFSFLKENVITGHRLRLLLFWGRHPQAKFNLDGIAHFLDITCFHMRELLREMISKGIIEETYCASGIAHYSLNSGHALSEYIQELANLDWKAIMDLDGEVEREALMA
jgi:predicted transcriptional regulator